MKYKRTLYAAALLSVIISFGTLLSCGNQNSQADNSNNSVSGNSDITENVSEATETETEAVFPHEEKRYDGQVFTVLVDKEDGNLLDVTDFDIEEQNGETLNDAVYQRNLVMEEKFGITFASEHTTDMVNMTNTTVMSNSPDFDAIMPRLMNAGQIAMKGLGLELSSQEYMSLDQPWWDINSINDLSIGGKNYIIAGDIFYKHYDGTGVLFFNKDIAEDYQLGNIYQYVYDNNWTLDTFNELASKVKNDVDGNGKFDENDMYGFATQADYIHCMVAGSGVKYTSKDENDLPYLTLYDEKTVNVFEKIMEHYNNYTWDALRDGKGQHLSAFWVFPKNLSLFYWGPIRYMDMGLRDMEDEFGILPIPKYDSSQERYYHLLNNWHTYSYMIPKSTGDVERSAYISDALAFYGREYILPAYYDSCLTRKYVRDDESKNMLDIIFTTATYDLGIVYSIGGMPSQIDGGIQSGAFDFASKYAKLEKSMNKSIENLIESFEEFQ